MEKEDLRSYKKGDIIFREGDAGDNLFIIKEGKIGIFRGKAGALVLLSTMGPGEIFGEMAILGSQKDSHFRIATAQAVEDSTLISINKFKMRIILSKVPHWFIVLFNSVTERLRHMDYSIKSKFKLGMDYSILHFILLFSKSNGERIEENRFLIGREELEKETCNTLGISEEYYRKWYEDLNKAHLLMEKEEGEKVEITDTETIKELLFYIKSMKTVKHAQSNEELEKILTYFKQRHDSFYIFSQ